MPEATTLKEFCDIYEDYEEPKMSYFINWFGEVSELSGYISNKEIKKLKEIGNYFETKEEAEKAAEKLKAWKRLKDKGFINEQVFTMNLNWCNPDDDDWKAFKVLFGGEE